VSDLDRPAIDVVMCCYNSQKYLSEAIDSVLDQTYNNWHLVIINDGSTDATEQIIKSYISSGVPITYHKQKNQGFASARQQALGLSNNDWIALLDHDDIWYPNKLEIQAQTIAKHKDLGILFSNSEQFVDDGTLVRLTLQPDTYSTGLMENAFDELFSYGCYIDSITAVLNKNALIEIGGFDNSYEYIADYDVFIKLASRYKVYFEHQLLARWRIHSNQATQTMTPRIIEEHVRLFEWVLRTFSLNQRTEIEVKRHLFQWLNDQSALYIENRNFSKFFSSITNLIKASSQQPSNYLRIGRILATWLKKLVIV
jgi:glycosyltransferase involved in cell wall biosynthesis